MNSSGPRKWEMEGKTERSLSCKLVRDVRVTSDQREVPVPHLCSTGSARSCQVLISIDCEARSRCAKCSSGWNGNRLVRVTSSCMDHVPSMEVHRPLAERFPSTSPREDTIATSATAKEINWSFALPFTTKRSTKLPSTCAKRSAARYPGSRAGERTGTEEKRHRYLNHQSGRAKPRN